MTDGADVTDALATAADQEYEVYQGVTFPGLYAMIANAHMNQYGTTRNNLQPLQLRTTETELTIQMLNSETRSPLNK